MAARSLMRLRLWVGRRGLYRSRGGIVDHVLKFLAGLEERNLLGRDLDAGAGFWIASDARLPLPRAETTEAADFDLIAATQGLHDAVEDRLNDDLGFLASHFHYPRDLFNQIRLGHFSRLLVNLAKN